MEGSRERGEEVEVVEVPSRMIAWLYCFLPDGHPVCVPVHPVLLPTHLVFRVREIYIYIYTYNIGVVVAGSSFNNSASRATREEEGSSTMPEKGWMGWTDRIHIR